MNIVLLLGCCRHLNIIEYLVALVNCWRRLNCCLGAENMMPDCGYTRLGGKELRCFKHFKTELGCSPRAIVLLKLDNQSIDKIQSSLKIEV